MKRIALAALLLFGMMNAAHAQFRPGQLNRVGLCIQLEYHMHARTYRWYNHVEEDGRQRAVEWYQGLRCDELRNELVMEANS